MDVLNRAAFVKLKCKANSFGAVSRPYMRLVWEARGAWLLLSVVMAILFSAWFVEKGKHKEMDYKGVDIRPTGLRPVFPEGSSCPPITSLYASWTDVDGSRRKEPHSGIDAGNFGDEILSPGPATVLAVWKTNFGWGEEGALLLLHEKSELNLTEGPEYYYSEFDHLNFSEISKWREGDRVERGEVLGHVGRPGGKWYYLPEVHWEVYEVRDLSQIVWHSFKSGLKYFTNDKSSLIDPLFLLSRQHGISENSRVNIVPYQQDDDYSGFRGFTYILRCKG